MAQFLKGSAGYGEGTIAAMHPTWWAPVCFARQSSMSLTCCERHVARLDTITTAGLRPAPGAARCQLVCDQADLHHEVIT